MLSKMVNRSAAMVAVTMGWVPFAAPALGDIISHNGLPNSTPAGIGDVDVLLHFTNSTGGTYSGDLDVLALLFNETARHELTYEYDSGEPAVTWFELGFNNLSGTLWHSFRIDLMGADLFGIGSWLTGDPGDQTQARSDNPLTRDITAFDEIVFNSSLFTDVTSSITRRGDVTSLWMSFDTPVPLYEGFSVAFTVDGGGTGFEHHATPNAQPIPAPGALLLGGIGVGSIVALRRRVVGRIP